MGRNIWQSSYAVAMIKSVRSIVHNNLDLREASEVYTKEKETQIKEHQKEIKSVG